MCPLEQNAPEFCEMLRDFTFPTSEPDDNEFTAETEGLGFEITVRRVGDYIEFLVPKAPHPSGEMFSEDEPKTCETKLREVFGNLTSQNEDSDTIEGLKYLKDEDGTTLLRISRASLIMNNIL